MNLNDFRRAPRTSLGGARHPFAGGGGGGAAPNSGITTLALGEEGGGTPDAPAPGTGPGIQPAPPPPGGGRYNLLTLPNLAGTSRMFNRNKAQAATRRKAQAAQGGGGQSYSLTGKPQFGTPFPQEQAVSPMAQAMARATAGNVRGGAGMIAAQGLNKFQTPEAQEAIRLRSQQAADQSGAANLANLNWQMSQEIPQAEAERLFGVHVPTRIAEQDLIRRLQDMERERAFYGRQRDLGKMNFAMG